jgi:hypothetical protein
MTRSLILTLILMAGAVNVFAQFSRPGLVEWQLGVLQSKIKPLYRKPTKEELKSVVPSDYLLERYAEFLREPHTGLTKLINDKGCSENTKVISASDDCLKHAMPGSGSAFSFREETYRLPQLADVVFTDNSFQASGVILHGIFVKLGDVPVDEVTLQTMGLNFLVNFRPEPDFARAGEIDRRLMQGIIADGFLYRRGLYAVDNSTYALRSIAYGGKHYRAASGITYNEFDFDKREDVIVIFRIVERDSDGDVTILWKKLQEKGSPKVNWASARSPEKGSNAGKLPPAAEGSNK